MQPCCPGAQRLLHTIKHASRLIGCTCSCKASRLPALPLQVRALKQDLVATGGLQRAGPAALLEVDKVS